MLLGPQALQGRGNARDNLIVGHEGEQVLRGLDGDDTLDGGGGADRLEGGGGIDRVRYDGSSFDYRVAYDDAQQATTVTRVGDDADVDLLIGVEFIDFDDLTLALPLDLTAPVLRLSEPFDGDAAVPVRSAIVLEFGEPLQSGDARVLLLDAAGTVQAVYGEPAGLPLQIDGTVVRLEPPGRLPSGAGLQLVVEAGAVRDLAGNPAQASSLVFRTADNQWPQVGDGAWSVDEDGLLSASLPQGVDADGDALVYTVVEPPSHGALELQADGRFVYIPHADFHGTDRFGFATFDGLATSEPASAWLTVAPLDDAPVASAASFPGREDEDLAAALTAVDVDGDVLTFAVAAPPSHGTLVLEPDGRFVYTPVRDFHGVDRFSVTAGDGRGESGPVTVTLSIEAVNDPPRAGGTTLYTRAGTTLQGMLPAAFDPDGDTVAYAVERVPAYGALTIAPDGFYRYTPDPGRDEPDSFDFSVSDGQGGTSSHRVQSFPSSWQGIAQMANAWFNGTFGAATMRALAGTVGEFFLGDTWLFAAEVYVQYGAPFEPSDLAQSVANNLGLQGPANAAFAQRVAAALYAVPDPYERGRILLAETLRFASLVDDPVYGEAARRFNAEIDAALAYAGVTGTLNTATNEDGSPVTVPAASGDGASFAGPLAAGSAGATSGVTEDDGPWSGPPPAMRPPEVDLVGVGGWAGAEQGG